MQFLAMLFCFVVVLWSLDAPERFMMRYTMRHTMRYTIYEFKRGIKSRVAGFDDISEAWETLESLRLYVEGFYLVLETR